MKITDVTSYAVYNGQRNNLFVVVDTDEGISGVGEAGLTGRELAVDRRDRAPQAAAGRPGPEPDRAPLAADVPRRLLPGQAGHRQRDLGHRHRAVGHPGQGARRAGLQAARRAACATRSSATRTTRRRARPRRQALVESCQRTNDEGWKFVRWGLPERGRACSSRARAVRHGARAVRGGARGASATRSRSASTSTPGWICPTRSGCAGPVEAVPPVLHRGPAALGEPALVPAAAAAARRVPLAAGEQFAGKWEFRELIEEELIDYARIDLCIVGGITEARKIAGWCETHYIKLAHAQPARAGLQRGLPAAQPGRPATSACRSSRAGRHDADRRRAGPDGVGGRLPAAADRPGLGIEFDREAAGARPFQMTRAAAPAAAGRVVHELVTRRACCAQIRVGGALRAPRRQSLLPRCARTRSFPRRPPA